MSLRKLSWFSMVLAMEFGLTIFGVNLSEVWPMLFTSLVFIFNGWKWATGFYVMSLSLTFILNPYGFFFLIAVLRDMPEGILTFFIVPAYVLFTSNFLKKKVFQRRIPHYRT